MTIFFMMKRGDRQKEQRQIEKVKEVPRRSHPRQLIHPSTEAGRHRASLLRPEVPQRSPSRKLIITFIGAGPSWPGWEGEGGPEAESPAPADPPVNRAEPSPRVAAATRGPAEESIPQADHHVHRSRAVLAGLGR